MKKRYVNIKRARTLLGGFVAGAAVAQFADLKILAAITITAIVTYGLMGNLEVK